MCKIVDMSRMKEKKCGKLHITYILSSQRSITRLKIDAKWRHSNLICNTLKQSHVQIWQSMYEKSAENGRTETRTNWRRVGRTDITIPYYVPSEDGRINSNVTTHKSQQNFDYTTIKDRLRTVSWGNDSHPTALVKPVYGIPTCQLTAKAL